MTNKEAKEKAIREAWGEQFDKNVSLVTGTKGGCEQRGSSISAFSYYPPDKGYTWDVMNNNGWTRIEPDHSNLPPDGTVCKIVVFGKVYSLPYTWDLEENHFEDNHFTLNVPLEEVTHYKTYEKDKSPIW